MQINPNKIPNHLAIILDGNGRWAKEKHLPRIYGHRKGAHNIINIANECSNIGIKFLTLYCFSTENWNRPESEIKYLFGTPIKYYKRYKEKIWNSNYKINIIGRRDRLPKNLISVIQELEEKTRNNTLLTITFCIDYGSHDEITSAIKDICLLIKDNKISINDISPDMIENHLYTKNLPKLDLLIRTSGEQRLSNFLLWQASYAELYFTTTYWPDFNKVELNNAIINYQNRNRRFGGLYEDN